MYSQKINNFFKNELVEIVLLMSISASIIIAAVSIFIINTTLDMANYIFCAVFFVELSIRFFSYEKKSNYFKDYLLDWISIIPWELFLIGVININLSYMRLLRIPRIIRILRFSSFPKIYVFEKLYYVVGKQFEKSFVRQVLFLIFFIFLLILSFGSLFSALKINFEQGNPFWFSLLSLFGPDSLYTIVHENGMTKFFAVLLTLLGILIFNGLLIAIVVSRIQKYLDEIKEGRGNIIEKDHIVILGWSDLIPFIIDELTLYCKTEKKFFKIIVLTINMHKEINIYIKKTKYIEVIHRIGYPYRVSDLKRMDVNKSNGIIIFCDEDVVDSDVSYVYDSFVTKSFISLVSVLSIDNLKKIPIVLLNFMQKSNSKFIKYFKNEKSTVFNNVFYNAKFIFLLTLNPNYFYVFSELLSYHGSEFHFYKNKKISNRNFLDILCSSEKSIPVGILRDRKLILLPDDNFVTGENDSLIILAKNERSISVDDKLSYNTIALSESLTCSEYESNLRNVAIIGLNNRLPFILDEFIKLKFNVSIYGKNTIKDFNNWVKENKCSINKKITYKQCTFKTQDEILKKIPLNKIQTVIILGDELSSNKKDTNKIDADTLFKLLKIIDLKNEKFKNYNFNIITEIIDPETEDIIKRIPYESLSYVVGSLIISKLISMTMLDINNKFIYNELLQKGGTDITINRGSCIFESKEILFKDILINSYIKLKIIPIGYIKKNEKRIILNPLKTEIISNEDDIIYLEKSGFEIEL